MRGAWWTGTLSDEPHIEGVGEGRLEWLMDTESSPFECGYSRIVASVLSPRSVSRSRGPMVTLRRGRRDAVLSLADQGPPGLDMARRLGWSHNQGRCIIASISWR